MWRSNIGDRRQKNRLITRCNFEKYPSDSRENLTSDFAFDEISAWRERDRDLQWEICCTSLFLPFSLSFDIFCDRLMQLCVAEQLHAKQKKICISLGFSLSPCSFDLAAVQLEFRFWHEPFARHQLHLCCCCCCTFFISEQETKGFCEKRTGYELFSNQLWRTWSLVIFSSSACE